MRWCLDCETQYPDSMDVCPRCGSEFFTDEPISGMPRAKLERGRAGKGEAPAPEWPLDAEGQPVRPALLENILSANQMEYEMRTGLLNAFGIPTLNKFPHDGSLGHIILGFSGYGMNIYVPETMLEEAKSILESEED